MNKNIIINEILNLENKIGSTTICLEKHSKSDFTLGYYYDVQTNEYKVYKNTERGRQSIRYSGTNEIDALNTLLNMVKAQAAMLTHIKEQL